MKIFLSCAFFLVATTLVAQIKSDSLPDSSFKATRMQRQSSSKVTAVPETRRKINPAVDSGRKHYVTGPAQAIQSQEVKEVLPPDSPGKAEWLSRGKDTVLARIIPSVPKLPDLTGALLSRNRYINVTDQPVFFIEQEKKVPGKEFLFYSLCAVALVLGVFKTFYNGYFKNLFRVYFNTSLRQTQLTDQLLQAKLPSFILNIFFSLTTGIYIWLLFNHYHPPRLISSQVLLPFCILSVALLYLIKFCLLKFMGWVSDIQTTTDQYIFAIFMVNKITGILLVPVIILLAFLKTEWIPVIANISFMALGLFFLSRYVKSYGAVEKKFPLNPFHFLIYIVGAEIIPLVILYKVAVDYLI